MKMIPNLTREQDLGAIEILLMSRSAWPGGIHKVTHEVAHKVAHVLRS